MKSLCAMTADFKRGKDKKKRKPKTMLGAIGKGAAIGAGVYGANLGLTQGVLSGVDAYKGRFDGISGMTNYGPKGKAAIGALSGGLTGIVKGVPRGALLGAGVGAGAYALNKYRDSKKSPLEKIKDRVRR